MKGFEIVLDILKYILPSIIVFFTSYILVGKFLQERTNREIREFKRQSEDLVNPLKLQAYERLMMLLERLSPQQLITNNSIQGLTVFEAKHLFSEAINAEYNHNVSQQIYVSSQLWSLVKVVKEEVIELFNSSAEGLSNDSSGVDLCKVVVNRLIENQTQPTQKAIDFLKAEVKLYFA
jgi:hypothetical protein